MKRRHLLSATIAVTLALGTYQAYAYDENFKGYEVHNIMLLQTLRRMSMVIRLLSNPIIVQVVT